MSPRVLKFLFLGLPISLIGIGIGLLFIELPPDIAAKIERFQTIFASILAIVAALTTAAALVITNRMNIFESRRTKKITDERYRKLALIYIYQALNQFLNTIVKPESEITRESVPSILYSYELIKYLRPNEISTLTDFYTYLDVYLNAKKAANTIGREQTMEHAALGISEAIIQFQSYYLGHFHKKSKT